jgi:polycystin 2
VAVDEDMPGAMENEVYVNGQLHVNGIPKNKKKSGKKNNKKNAPDTNCQALCNIFGKMWSTRQTQEIDKVNDPDTYVKVTLRELAIYIAFIIVLCILGFGMTSTYLFTFVGTLQSAFLTSQSLSSPYLSLQTVTQMGDIWTYLQDPNLFVGNLYSFWYTAESGVSTPATAPNLQGYIQNENYVLGLARLRQIRVQNNSCTIPSAFSQQISVCFSDYTPSVEDKNGYGPYVWYNQTNDPAWYWQSESQLKGSSFQGIMNQYDGSGFVQVLSSNQSATIAIIESLFTNLWIDRATRAVFIDFTVYNANINLFCQVKIVFELPATGGVVPQVQFLPVKLIRYVTGFDYFVMVCEIIFCLFVAYYTVEEIIEIKRNKWEYFKAVWNILDIVILCIAYVCIIFDIYAQVSVSSLLNQLLTNQNQFVDFTFLSYWQTQFNNAIAGMIFIAWIKIFKYISFNKTMTQLSMTLSRCAKDVTGFAIMFFIVFLAYAQLGYLIFGTQVQDFSTFANSIFTLFRIILGDFDFEAIEAANRVLGPIFFLTYVFFVFFVLLNMFIAIINDTYGEIKEEIAAQKSDIELASFFKKGYNKVLDKLNLRRTQIVEIQNALSTADVNADNKIDYDEFRNSLRAKGYADAEIEALFSKYDVDGDRVLNHEEQKAMYKDFSTQNDELKKAYLILDQTKSKKDSPEAIEKKKKRSEGVPYEDYTFLSSRIDKMETSIGSIVNKVDTVLAKLDQVEKAKKEGKQSSAGGNSSHTTPENGRDSTVQFLDNLAPLRSANVNSGRGIRNRGSQSDC